MKFVSGMLKHHVALEHTDSVLLLDRHILNLFIKETVFMGIY
jgi:hypothetical protein